MNIGDLDRRITIQSLDSTQDPVTGHWKKDWSDWKILAASKVDMPAHDRMQANQIINIGDEVFTIRYNSGVNTTQRISWDGNLYELKSIQEIGRKRWMRIIAQRLS